MLKTKTKTKTNKISLSQLVKAIENINVEDIPLNEKNHTLIGKVFNKFNSLKKSHFKKCISGKIRSSRSRYRFFPK